MITQKPADLEVGLQEDGSTGRPAGTRPPGSGRRRSIWFVVAGIVIVLLLAWGIARLAAGNANAPRYVTAAVQYRDINSTVEETGTVNPVDEVDVGTQVSGTISSLNVDYNSVVHKGEVLATLDQTPFRAAALQAHGNVAAAQANAAAAQSTAAQSGAAIQNAIAAQRSAAAGEQSADANVAKAQAQVTLSQATVARDRSLLSQGFISQSQLDADIAAQRTNQADLQAAQSALQAARAQAAAATTSISSASYQHAANVNQAQAAAAQAAAGQGQVQQADYNLQNAVITSPIDGIVVSRAVSVGQTVAASFQTPTLFVIASSLKDMQVDVSVSEADVGQLKAGQTARITVPAYPNTVFNGTVQQVRINPTNVQNVVTYDAIVSVHDDSSRLKPGMTADVVIDVSSHTHVLAIPAAALLFKPADARSFAGGSQSGGAQGGGFGASGGSSQRSGQGGGAGGQAGGGSQGSGSQVAGAPGSRAVVWVLRAGKTVPVRIVIGASDGRYYEVSSGQLSQGDQVIVGQLQQAQVNNSNPMAGGPGFGR